MSALMCSHMSARSHLCLIFIIITTTSLVSFCSPPHGLGSLAGIKFLRVVQAENIAYFFELHVVPSIHVSKKVPSSEAGGKLGRQEGR